MGSFSIKKGSVEKITARLLATVGAVDADMARKMDLATTIVWKTATARRPKISKTEQKALGRSSSGYRVSDPNAKLGVPVKTGVLQVSIKKNFNKQGKKWVGTVSTNNPYAGYMEFGTRKIKPRPFMRPAINEQRGAVLRIFNTPMKP